MDKAKINKHLDQLYVELVSFAYDWELTKMVEHINAIREELNAATSYSNLPISQSLPTS